MITESELKTARALLEKLNTALVDKDNLKTLKYNTKFHEVFIHACPNKRFSKIDRICTVFIAFLQGKHYSIP
ncbi:DNA-binding GntR family transcriptional regulator [Cytobacillus purgationiresistens]|uniref:DNA-binding GntR family transcriptional regulator n=1 Tax=Cytobacillus purgationiresistens TaxID=863449 RepID=A0ABU0ALQ5_9BACI|nr:DNA-binding GntR family transcriptional regulator [Cytobacillus purgationiresistens]